MRASVRRAGKSCHIERASSLRSGRIAQKLEIPKPTINWVDHSEQIGHYGALN